MIDFDKQPHCLHCPHCVGWAYPRGQQDCAERMDYKEDGSCKYDAEARAKYRFDDYIDRSNSNDDDDY